MKGVCGEAFALQYSYRRDLEGSFSEAFVCAVQLQANVHFLRPRILSLGGGFVELSGELLPLFSLWRQSAYVLSLSGACARFSRGKGGSADCGFYFGMVTARLEASVL